MMENNSDNKKQPWLVPIVVAVVGAISTIAVALINGKQPSSQEPTSKSETYTLQAIDLKGIEIPVSKGETLTIDASGKVYTNQGGNVSEYDIQAGRVWSKPVGRGKGR